MNLTEVYIAWLMSSKDLLNDLILKRVKTYRKLADISYLHNIIRQFVQELTHTLADTFNPKAFYQDQNSLPAIGNGGSGRIISDLSSIKKLMDQGISLNTYLLLIRAYRDVYKDLLDKASWSTNDRQLILLFSENCFEVLEYSVTEKWIECIRDLDSRKPEPVWDRPVLEENTYLEVFENIYAPIILLDAENLIVNYNLAASCLFIDLKVKSPFFTIKVENDSSGKPIHDQLEIFVNSELRHFNFDTYINCAKGQRYFKVIFKKLVNEYNLFSGVIVMMEDLTSYKQAEKNLNEAKLRAEEADQLKTAFLANMSHEIRTPMNAILGFTELMLNSNYSSKERKEFLQLIRTSSSDLLTIIEDIIDIAKMESKQLKIKYKACNPFETLSDLYVLFNESIRRLRLHKDLKLILDVAEADRDILIFTDTERLKQVLSNLLNNAVKFTSKGSIEFGYKLINEASVFFFVRDTGEGIPEAMKSKIFDRFVQVERHSDKNYRGAGLGLAICKNIINIMGGEIWVESVENKGSDFYFIIPRRNVPEELLKEKHIGNSEYIHDVDLRKRSILIAEDDEINFIYLKEILRKYEITIYRARNGLDAINIAETTENIDVILMDIKMPLVDGLEATSYISRIRPEIPIIAQTAFAMNGDEKKCMEAGCCAYVTKPVDPQNLLKTILKFLSPKQTAAETHEITK